MGAGESMGLMRGLNIVVWLPLAGAAGGSLEEFKFKMTIYIPNMHIIIN